MVLNYRLVDFIYHTLRNLSTLYAAYSIVTDSSFIETNSLELIEIFTRTELEFILSWSETFIFTILSGSILCSALNEVLNKEFLLVLNEDFAPRNLENISTITASGYYHVGYAF